MKTLTAFTDWRNTGIREFTPSGSGTGNDWLLVPDSKKAWYKMPQ